MKNGEQNGTLHISYMLRVPRFGSIRNQEVFHPIPGLESSYRP